MTANHEHTPDTEEVCSAYVQHHHFQSYGMDDSEETEKSFYRMIAQVEAAAEQRGAVRAFKESANEVRRELRWQYEQNINRNSDAGDSIDRLFELEKVFKYRADRLEDDE